MDERPVGADATIHPPNTRHVAVWLHAIRLHGYRAVGAESNLNAQSVEGARDACRSVELILRGDTVEDHPRAGWHRARAFQMCRTHCRACHYLLSSRQLMKELGGASLVGMRRDRRDAKGAVQLFGCRSNGEAEELKGVDAVRQHHIS